jgi:hypothetical protein
MAPALEKWRVYQIRLRGPLGWRASLTPPLTATFEHAGASKEVPGFWDGEETYVIRFMPDEPGLWTWRTRSALTGLDGRAGRFTVTAPSSDNHGPVRVADTYHFAHADGKPFHELGTTSYAWAHQPQGRRSETLLTLAGSPFNKLRMAVFPNASVHTEPLFPFLETDGAWDLSSFNPSFFRNLDDCVRELGAIGVQADIILFHPYDDARGFSAMSPAHDEIYLRYLIARLSAYQNVWWSAANEWDLIKSKTETDFDRILEIVREADPYDRLRSIHQWRQLYNHNQPWVTHASIQNGAAVEDDARALIYRDAYRKPVVFDEVRYEGDIAARWGNLTGEELTRAFWEAHIAGCYCGHGEAFQPDLWMGVGGSLRGQSIARLAFLKRVMEGGPAEIDPIDRWWGRHIGGKAGQYYLRYFGETAPSEWRIDIPRDQLSGGERFRAEIVDTWNMTVTPVEGPFTLSRSGDYSFTDLARPVLALPSRPWMAVRMVRLS